MTDEMIVQEGLADFVCWLNSLWSRDGNECGDGGESGRERERESKSEKTPQPGNWKLQAAAPQVQFQSRSMKYGEPVSFWLLPATTPHLNLIVKTEHEHAIY